MIPRRRSIDSIKGADDKTELLVNIPQEGSPEFQIFSTEII